MLRWCVLIRNYIPLARDVIRKNYGIRRRRKEKNLTGIWAARR